MARHRLPYRPVTRNERLILFWADLMGPGKVAAEFHPIGPLPHYNGVVPLIWKVPSGIEQGSRDKVFTSVTISRLVKAKYLQYCQPAYPRQFGYARGVQITPLGRSALC